MSLFVRLLLALACSRSKSSKLAKHSEIERVKIGVLASLNGSGFSLGRNTVAALQIAARDLKNIGPQYRPVRFRFLVRDTQHDPSRALDAIQDLNARGVKIIIGPQTSSEVAMIKPFADAHNILVISQGSTASSLAIPGDNIFRFCPNGYPRGGGTCGVTAARWHSRHCSSLAQRRRQQRSARFRSDKVSGSWRHEWLRGFAMSRPPRTFPPQRTLLPPRSRA